MKQVVVAVEQTLNGYLTVEIEDEDELTLADAYAIEGVNDGDLNPHWEGGSVRVTQHWPKGAPCEFSPRTHTTLGDYKWCSVHDASAAVEWTRCFMVDDIEART